MVYKKASVKLGALIVVAGIAALLSLGSFKAFAAKVKKPMSLNVQAAGAVTAATPALCAVGSTFPDTDTCQDLSLASDALSGNQGLGNGSLTFTLTIDVSDTVGPNKCFPGTGTGSITKKKNSMNFNASGLLCPTLGSTTDVFTGSYVITGGSGEKFESAAGAGSFSASVNTINGLTQMAITGSM